MPKLSKAKKDEIISRAMEKCGISEQVRSKEKLMEDEVWKAFIGQWSEHAEAMAELPENFFEGNTEKTGKFIDLYVGGHNIWFNRAYKAVDRIPACYNRSRLSLPAGHPVQKIYDEIQSLRDRYLQAEEQIRSLVYSFNTDKQLQEGWPEGKEFYHDVLDTPSWVPAIVDTKAVNALLGI